MKVKFSVEEHNSRKCYRARVFGNPLLAHVDLTPKLYIQERLVILALFLYSIAAALNVIAK